MGVEDHQKGGRTFRKRQKHTLEWRWTPKWRKTSRKRWRWIFNWSIGVPFDAPWPSSLWSPWYPLWYPPLAPITIVALSSRKSLLYPIYFTRTDPNADVQVF
jgi:hypothetical protein